MSRRFDPKLNKKLYLTHANFVLYTVNGLAVRNASQVDEEFGNFACQDEFPDCIGPREVWLSEKLAAREGVFFAANALTYLAKETSAPNAAYEAGIAAERALREAVTGIAFRDGKPHKSVPAAIYLDEYLTLPDPKGPITVHLIDGHLARCYYKTDYTQGGHGVVYPWVPKAQIWLEDGVDQRELPYILCHEYLERRLMRDAGLGYARAHEIASALEYDLRMGTGLTPLLAKGGRRHIAKADLPGLCAEKVYEFVNAHYRHGGPAKGKG